MESIGVADIVKSSASTLAIDLTDDQVEDIRGTLINGKNLRKFIEEMEDMIFDTVGVKVER